MIDCKDCKVYSHCPNCRYYPKNDVAMFDWDTYWCKKDHEIHHEGYFDYCCRDWECT